MTDSNRWRQWLPDFVLLGLIWGSSFLFMRLTSQEFGSWTTAWLRVSVAWLTLLPFLLWQGQASSLRQHWRRILPMGVVNSGIPFICYAYAVMYISTGMSSILNSTTPLFGALIAWVWLKQPPGRSRGLGLLLGFAGAALLALTMPGGISFKAGGSGWAVLACLVATTCYGLSTHYSQRYLSGVPTMTIAAGSQIGASLALLIPGIWFLAQRVAQRQRLVEFADDWRRVHRTGLCALFPLNSQSGCRSHHDSHLPDPLVCQPHRGRFLK